MFGEAINPLEDQTVAVLLSLPLTRKIQKSNYQTYKGSKLTLKPKFSLLSIMKTFA
jgi:hypothetical protein